MKLLSDPCFLVETEGRTVNANELDQLAEDLSNDELTGEDKRLISSILAELSNQLRFPTPK